MNRCSPCRVYLVLTLAAWLAGCGGTGPSGEIRVPLDQQHRLEPSGALPAAVALPADRAFNIHIKRSSQQPGPNGEATSTADANEQGQAKCQARATNGGAANAEFHLGDRVKNQTDEPLEITLDVTFDLDQAIQASPAATHKTLAHANLKLTVVDAHKRVLRELWLVEANSDRAASRAQVRERRSLTGLPLPAQQSLDIMLVGTVDAAADDNQESSADLTVSDLTFKLSFKPGPTQTARR